MDLELTNLSSDTDIEMLHDLIASGDVVPLYMGTYVTEWIKKRHCRRLFYDIKRKRLWRYNGIDDQMLCLKETSQGLVWKDSFDCGFSYEHQYKLDLMCIVS